MKKSYVYFSLFVALVISGLVEAVSGFVLWIALPSGGSGGNHAVSEAAFLGLTRHTWLDLHDWFAIALIVIVTIHALLHWPWIWRMTKKYFSKLLPHKQEALAAAK